MDAHARADERIQAVVCALLGSRERTHHEAAAATRATALLQACLTEREWAQFTTHGYLEVASPATRGRCYRIPRTGGMVEVYQDDQLLMWLCVGPAQPLPPDDVVLLHLLMIRGDEQTYLATANHFPLRW
jgi:hypothetical protein